MNREQIIEMAKEAGLVINSPYLQPHEYQAIGLERFAALVAAAEREECAKTVENERIGFADDDEELHRIAALIRARGSK